MKRLIFAAAMIALWLGYGVTASAEVSTCTLTFGMSKTDVLNSIQFTVDYSAVQGTFAGAGAEVQCRTSVNDSASVVVDKCDGDYSDCQWGPDRKLMASVLRNTGFAGPREILTCIFETAETPDPIDFRVVVNAAGEAKGLAGVSELPAVDIVSIKCPADSTEKM